jgi:uncharacterized protein YndB with AHSA1/START domain
MRSHRRACSTHKPGSLSEKGSDTIRLTTTAQVSVDGVTQGPAGRRRTSAAGSSAAAGRGSTTKARRRWTQIDRRADAFLSGRRTDEIFADPALRDQPSRPARRDPMPRSEFVYVTYIKTTPDELWHALTDPDVMARWRFGTHAESDWRVASPWKMVTQAGEILDTGEVVESDPPTRLTLTWRSEWKPELTAEGYSRCTFAIEAVNSTATQLIVTQSIDRSPSQLIEGVSMGWPRTLSNLKSFLETGETVLEGTR